MLSKLIRDETELVSLGRCFSRLVGEHLQVNLIGDLGAGKTTFVRGVLMGAGFDGAVKSPTFSLVEPYELPKGRVFHFDLYRLESPDELEYIGIRDYLHQAGLSLIEWPEKAGEILPTADIDIIIKKTGKGRQVFLKTGTDSGKALCKRLSLAECMSEVYQDSSHRPGQD